MNAHREECASNLAIEFIPVLASPMQEKCAPQLTGRARPNTESDSTSKVVWRAWRACRTLKC